MNKSLLLRETINRSRSLMNLLACSRSMTFPCEFDGFDLD
jgi:hypothetical protein